MKAAIGNYINFFTEDGKKDVFIILNEYNREPTIDDYILIENTLDEHISKYGKVDISKLETLIEDTTSLGVQVVVKHWED